MSIEDLPAQVDLGYNHSLKFLGDPQGHVLGGIMMHPAKADRMVGLRRVVAAGETCSGCIWLRVPELNGHITAHPGHYETWAVTSWNPISLDPSLLCNCGDHGRIVDGEWAPY